MVAWLSLLEVLCRILSDWPSQNCGFISKQKLHVCIVSAWHFKVYETYLISLSHKCQLYRFLYTISAPGRLQISTLTTPNGNNFSQAYDLSCWLSTSTFIFHSFVRYCWVGAWHPHQPTASGCFWPLRMSNVITGTRPTVLWLLSVEPRRHSTHALRTIPLC